MGTRLEVPIFGPTAAETAVSAGASRIELNAKGSYSAGGLTPSIEEFAQLRDLEVPIRIMIRPRGQPNSGVKDFIYSETELETMEQSIRMFRSSRMIKENRGDGFVFGVLRDAGIEKAVPASAGSHVVLDVDNCRRLAEAAKPYKTVFHRAFDELVPSGEFAAALKDLAAHGIDGILTSGGPGNAGGNIVELDRILEDAGDRIEIIVGGGVRSSNVGELTQRLRLLQDRTRSHWVHSSCLTRAGSENVDRGEVEAILKELE
jgi:copper homeostasis protein